MTRVNVVAAVCCVALMFAVSNVNAQCASCGQAAQPVFSQSYASPIGSAPVYAQPQYAVAQPMMASSIATGCSSCGTAGLAVQRVSYAAPIMSGCNSCGCGDCGCASSAPIVAQPINVGCATCSTYQAARPQVVRTRVRVLSQRRAINTCAPCNSCY